MYKKLLIVVLCAGMFSFPLSASAESVAFEVHFANVDSAFWGRGTGIAMDELAEKYTPPDDQIVCSVNHRIAGYNNPTDSVTMWMYSGGSVPGAGTLIASSTLPASALVNGSRAYIPFGIAPCIKLQAGATYWFLFNRSQPSTLNGYISQMRMSDEYSYASYWQNRGVNKPGWEENPQREWSLQLTGPDFAPHEPVIIVPGILGTRLNRVSDGEEVWPNAPQMIKDFQDAYLNDLLLDAFGGQTAISSMSPTGLVESSYENLVDAFISAGYASGTDVFTAPYDWRLDLKSSTGQLDRIVKAAIAKSPTGKVNIIAHSMGGLLTKEYLRQASSTTFVDKLLLAGVPELGSPKGFKALTYGDNFGIAFGSINFLSPDRIKIISQNMPSVYELLPSRSYLSNIGPYVLDFTSGAVHPLDYDQSREFMLRNQNDSRNPVLLSQADQFHEVIDSAGFNIPSESIYRLVGCQNPTIGDIRMYPKDKFDIDTIDGDGTVPLGSATYSSSSHNYFALFGTSRINHTGLVKDSKAVNLMRDIIVGTSTPALPVGISLNKSDCDEPAPDPFGKMTLSFSTHSPVALHIYDSQGRHTGPDANGDIELGIPGSSYERIGENSFVWVPGGETYKVAADATDIGAFDLKIKSYEGAVQKNLITYLSIPLLGPQTNAELNFTDIQVPPILALDADGDGQFEQQVEPSAVLAGSGAKDITPPTITTSGITATITDDESGVASSSVALDDTLTLKVSAYDKAGNYASAVRYCKIKQ